MGGGLAAGGVTCDTCDVALYKILFCTVCVLLMLLSLSITHFNTFKAFCLLIKGP